MKIKEFLLLRESVERARSHQSVVDDEGASSSVVYVPFASDGTILSVAKVVPFEPVAVPFRTYDAKLVRELSLNPLRTYRGDISSLLDVLSVK